MFPGLRILYDFKVKLHKQAILNVTINVITAEELHQYVNNLYLKNL